MEKNTKLIAGLMIALLAASALAIAPTVFAEYVDPESPVDAQQFSGWRHRRRARHPMLRYILKNGEYAQLTGTIVAQKGPILVLATGDATVNVILPPLWLGNPMRSPPTSRTGSLATTSRLRPCYHST
jgi:hypothetical protein